MDIKGLDKAAVLAALYNGSSQQGMGFLDLRGTSDLTVEEARQLLAKNTSKYFDYLYGRVLKISLAGDDVDTLLYNRDNGRGAAEAIIEELHADPK